MHTKSKYYYITVHSDIIIKSDCPHLTENMNIWRKPDIKQTWVKVHRQKSCIITPDSNKKNSKMQTKNGLLLRRTIKPQDVRKKENPVVLISLGTIDGVTVGNT
jgi:hypothetical protein